MSNKRSEIKAGPDGLPTLDGATIRPDEVLEIKTCGEWVRVQLGQERGKYKRWCLRPVNAGEWGTWSILAVNTLARRVTK